MEGRQQAYGRIKSYNEHSGNGYIEPDHGGSAIPFEREDVEDYQPGDVLRVGDRVMYDVVGGMAGTEAVHIRRIAPSPGE